MDFSVYSALFIPVTVVSMAVVAQVASNLQTQAVTRKATKVAQVENAVSRIAGGIAANLAGVQASTTADALTAIKNAAVAEGVAYLGSEMPNTLAAVGATPNSVSQMLHGEVGKQMLAALLQTPAVVPAVAAAVAVSPAAAAATPAADPPAGLVSGVR